MHFPFDDTLVGYQEVVTLKTSDLTLPIFTFPKGSFFVDGTYAVIKGTSTILRPGLDYLVLSCNETIPFSSNNDQNIKLKQAYVRNAILLQSDKAMELEWHVAYCGGEETTKASEYYNYINQLYNDARTKGTTNLYTTRHQAWGGYLNNTNEQVMSGKHIYSKSFRVQEDMEAGDGLGWGKVELAVEAIAESVAQGQDSGVIAAFFNWVKHNEIEFNKAKERVTAELATKIQNLDGKRVAIGQFIFKDEPTLPGSMRFTEHHNVMLRGLDPNQPEAYVNDPILTNRKDVGFYGLAEAGFDVNAQSARLFQRVASAAPKVRFGVVFESAIYNTGTIRMSLLKDVGAITTGTHTLYVVSKRLGLIHTKDVTSLLATASTTRSALSFSYTTTQVDFSLDSIFAYILDENMQGDFKWVGSAKVVINNVRHAFSLEAINRGNLIGPDTLEEIDGVSPQFEVVVKRTYSVNATTIALRAKLADAANVITINGASAINVAFAAGESEKRILVKLTNPAQLNDKQMVMLYLGPNANNVLASLLLGLKSVGKQDYAQISLLDNNNTQVSAIDVNNTYLLQVQFSKDADYFLGDLSLDLTRLLGTTATATLGDKRVVSRSIITYPIKFNGGLDSVISLGLLDSTNTAFKTNRLNIAYATANINPASPVFSPIVNGKNLRITRELDKYQLDFSIAVKDHAQGGYIFDLSSNNVDLVLPTSVISNNGLVSFRASIPINKLVTGTTRLTFKRGSVNHPLDFTVNINRLIAIEIDYQDGAYSDKALETKRAFRIMMTNPFTDRKLEITRDSFPSGLGITDIVYGNNLSEIIVDNLTLLPGERKQLTVGDWVSIEDIKSTTAPLTRYTPNCNVSQVLLSNNNVAKTGSYLTEVGEILFNKEDYQVQAINILTGTPLYDYGMVDNYIDVITQFEADISAVTKIAVATTGGFVATVRNLTISPIDKTIIAALTVKRNDNNLMDSSNINIDISYLNSSSVVLHKVTTSVTGR